jgi:four helix bundle protein
MARIERFEDIIAWQKARELNKLIYSVTQQGQFAKDFDLTRQIRRCSISILSNIAEGFERSSVKQFLFFLNIAKASAAELRAQLYVANDLNYITNETTEDMMARVISVSKMISGLMKYLQNSSGEVKEEVPEYSANFQTLELSNFSE